MLIQGHLNFDGRIERWCSTMPCVSLEVMSASLPISIVGLDLIN